MSTYYFSQNETKHTEKNIIVFCNQKENTGELYNFDYDFFSAIMGLLLYCVFFFHILSTILMKKSER